jgi:hypothetical protein
VAAHNAYQYEVQVSVSRSDAEKDAIHDDLMEGYFAKGLKQQYGSGGGGRSREALAVVAALKQQQQRRQAAKEKREKAAKLAKQAAKVVVEARGQREREKEDDKALEKAYQAAQQARGSSAQQVCTILPMRWVEKGNKPNISWREAGRHPYTASLLLTPLSFIMYSANFSVPVILFEEKAAA